MTYRDLHRRLDHVVGALPPRAPGPEPDWGRLTDRQVARLAGFAERLAAAGMDPAALTPDERTEAALGQEIVLGAHEPVADADWWAAACAATGRGGRGRTGPAHPEGEPRS